MCRSGVKSSVFMKTWPADRCWNLSLHSTDPSPSRKSKKWNVDQLLKSQELPSSLHSLNWPNATPALHLMWQSKQKTTVHLTFSNHSKILISNSSNTWREQSTNNQQGNMATDFRCCRTCAPNLKVIHEIFVDIFQTSSCGATSFKLAKGMFPLSVAMIWCRDKITCIIASTCFILIFNSSWLSCYEQCKMAVNIMRESVWLSPLCSTLRRHVMTLNEHLGRLCASLWLFSVFGLWLN